MTAKGIYTDKSEGVVTSHALKLFLQSPTFTDVAVVGKFFMDDSQFKLDLQVFSIDLHPKIFFFFSIKLISNFK